MSSGRASAGELSWSRPDAGPRLSRRQRDCWWREGRWRRQHQGHRRFLAALQRLGEASGADSTKTATSPGEETVGPPADGDGAANSRH